MSYGNHDETGLGQTVGTNTHAGKRIIHRFHLRARIYIVDNRINLGRIEIERLVHYAIQVGHSIGRLYGKEFRELIARSFQYREITLLQAHHLVSVSVYHIGTGNRVYP